jgi:copper chaperone
MIKNYELTGMSCGGCVSNVKQALLKVPDVKEAEVQLHPQNAVITMNKLIDVSELQAQLSKAGRYTIKEVA